MFWKQSEHHVVQTEQRNEQQSGSDERPAEGGRGQEGHRLTGREATRCEMDEETGESELTCTAVAPFGSRMWTLSSGRWSGWYSGRSQSSSEGQITHRRRLTGVSWMFTMITLFRFGDPGEEMKCAHKDREQDGSLDYPPQAARQVVPTPAHTQKYYHHRNI